MAASSREGHLTHLRRERKVPLSEEEAESIARLVASMHGLEAPPEVRITSVYFDHADGRLARAVEESPTQCLKIRTKEYDPDWGCACEARCVVELKRQRGPVTRKNRFWLPRASLQPLFRGPEGELGGHGSAVRSALRALATVGGTATLLPVVAVSYRRRVFQLSQELRITLDVGVRFHRISPELALSPRPLTHDALPEPFAAEARSIVEIKSLSAHVPDWIERILSTGPTGFSKFGAAVRLLAGRAAEPGRTGSGAAG